MIAIPVYENEIVMVEEPRIVFVPVIKTFTVAGLTMDVLKVVDGHVVPDIDLIPVVRIVRVPRLVRILQGFILR